MSFNRNSKKKVSFLVGESNLISNKNITHKTGILKAKNHKREKEEEKVQIIEEKKETKEKIEIKREEKINAKSNNPMKNLPSDEYFRLINCSRCIGTRFIKYSYDSSSKSYKISWKFFN